MKHRGAAYLLPSALALVAYVGAGLVCGCTGDKEAGPPTPDAAPSFDARDASGDVAVVPPFNGQLHRQWLHRDEYNTLSSPRAVDLNGDGILDIVMGNGAEFDREDGPSKDLESYGSVVAHDGRDGTVLWRFAARQDVVGSAVFPDLNGDATPDVVIGGRQSELVALNGRDGTLLWRFFDGTVHMARAQGLYSFFSPLRVPDQNGDGVDDLVVANGGDPLRPDYVPRPPGHIMVISGKDGTTLAAIATPDGQETYMSPTLLGTSPPHIVFGSGGETIAGSLWRIPLHALMMSDGSQAQRLATGGATGFIAPASLADFNADGFDDIVALAFGAEIWVIDGANNMPLLQWDFAGFQSITNPVLVATQDKAAPDIWLSIDKGKFPHYEANRHVLLKGDSGRIAFDQTMGLLGVSGNVAADLNGDGWDEVIFASNQSQGDASTVAITLNAAMNVQLFVFDPRAQNVRPFAEGFLRPAMAAPLLVDADADGLLDLFVVSTDLGKNVAVHRLERFDLRVKTPAAGMFGAYMGSAYNGRWRP